MGFDTPLLKDYTNHSYKPPECSCECLLISILVLTLICSIISNVILHNKCNVKNECELYGSLANGIVMWGENFNGSKIIGSTIISKNGTDSINNIIELYLKYNASLNTICFESIKRFC